ncbi:MAG TPA: hypothetical protein VLG76_07100 [Rhabdochlamydiaceae bacterium]|nr:hypothetical protein [Rhabdochlamydiaceae bacterium]
MSEFRPVTSTTNSLSTPLVNAAPIRSRAVSIESILEDLKIPREDWENHIHGARLFYESKDQTKEKMEARVYNMQIECLIKNQKVPSLLHALVAQLEQISDSDRERLLNSSSIRHKKYKRLPRSIESILKRLNIPDQDWDKCVYGAKWFFVKGDPKKEEVGSRFSYAQAACIEEYGRSHASLYPLIKRLERLSKQKREHFLKSYLIEKNTLTTVTPVSASSSLQSGPSQETHTQSSSPSYPSDSEESDSSATLAPISSKDSIESILEGLEILPEEWDVHMYGVELYFNCEKRPNLNNTRILRGFHRKCAQKYDKVPLQLRALIAQLRTIPESKRNLLLENFAKKED